MKILLLLIVALGGIGLHGQEIMRKMYSPYTVYEVKLIPGVPLCLEVPKGDSPKSIWCDNMWFKGESTPGSPRATLKALPMSGVVGHVTFFHVETEAGLRISIFAEAVHEPAVGQASRFPGVLIVDLDETAESQVAARAIHDLHQASEAAEKPSKNDGQKEEDLTKWKQETIRSIRASYRWGGDFQVEKVVDDRLQTLIFIPQGSDRATIEIVDRSDHAEKVNYEFLNGVYTIQKVLRSGERFRLLLGQEQEVIGLK